MDIFQLLKKFWLILFCSKYLKISFIVPGIISKLKKNSNLVPIKYMYKRGTSPETFFFIFNLILGTKNGVLKYVRSRNLKKLNWLKFFSVEIIPSFI